MNEQIKEYIDQVVQSAEKIGATEMKITISAEFLIMKDQKIKTKMDFKQNETKINELDNPIKNNGFDPVAPRI